MKTKVAYNGQDSVKVQSWELKLSFVRQASRKAELPLLMDAMPSPAIGNTNVSGSIFILLFCQQTVV